MDLKALKEICDKATEGPFIIRYEYAEANPYLITNNEHKYYVAFSRSLHGYAGNAENDFAFIAAARSALPKLLAIAEAASRAFIPHNHASVFCTQCFTDMKAREDVMAALRALEGR